MSARQLLDQLLQSGQGLARDASTRVQSATAGGNAPSFLAGLGGGALGAGALGLLMGGKKARKIGGKVAMYGGMAALGALAYRAYGDWQRNQSAQAGAPAPQTLDRLPPAQAEQHSSAILTAMIGAAKADGHIGPEERHLLETELGKLSADATDQRWLEAELARPLDPAAIATAAQTPEMAAEMYLASLLVVDEESYMERAYLDELARQLKLAPDLKTQLEAQVKTPA
ncbi:tellurite resistance TerB family protein [Bordetella sp. BOR01]|uniref:tellurite resistance TerB family protein n=1 Tax=Bordetella sp. BOR01 TaxID=2854779 RepID=UPI001C4720CE|nr:tellurite resistance TerB family protein [Bordetella sp. BOR01]MBV7484282.1 tellurite resistance TerB family protein [Bordetella sp. BOR01]